MLETRYLSNESLRGEGGPRLLRFLLQQGADEFSIRVMALQDTQAPFADAFEDELAPYERAMAPRSVVTSLPPTDVIRAVRLWSFTAASLERLLSFADDGIVQWPAGPDGWFEDLTIYRNHDLVLVVISADREAVLRLAPAEHAALAGLGIRNDT